MGWGWWDDSDWRCSLHRAEGFSSVAQNPQRSQAQQCTPAFPVLGLLTREDHWAFLVSWPSWNGAANPKTWAQNTRWQAIQKIPDVNLKWGTQFKSDLHFCLLYKGKVGPLCKHSLSMWRSSHFGWVAQGLVQKRLLNQSSSRSRLHILWHFSPFLLQAPLNRWSTWKTRAHTCLIGTCSRHPQWVSRGNVPALVILEQLGKHVVAMKSID